MSVCYLVKFAEHRVFQVDSGTLLQAIERFQTLVLAEVFQAQADRFSLAVGIVPLNARFH